MKPGQPQDAARPDAIERLRAKYPSLPEQYFRLLTRFGGVETNLRHSYVQLWGAEDALVATDQHKIPEYRPGYFAFGSNGGGELLVCALEGGETRPLYALPAIGMADAELLSIASSFSDLGAQLESAGANGV